MNSILKTDDHEFKLACPFSSQEAVDINTISEIEFENKEIQESGMCGTIQTIYPKRMMNTLVDELPTLSFLSPQNGI